MTEQTIDAYRDRIGATFRVAEAGVSFELVEVEPRGEHAFSVLFHGPAEPIVPQATYTFDGDGNGEASETLFVVPIGPAEGGEAMVYEAVFASVG